MFSSSSGFLAQGATPLKQFAPLGDSPPEIWSKNNGKVTITIEIYITIDFAPPPEKNAGRKSEFADKFHDFSQKHFLRSFPMFSCRSSENTASSPLICQSL